MSGNVVPEGAAPAASSSASSGAGGIVREGDLEQLGIVLLRGVADPAGLQAILARAQQVFAMLEGLSKAELQARGAGEFLYHGALNLAAVDPEMEILRALHPGILPAVTAFLGGGGFGFRNNIVRRIYPARPEASSSFHQDLQFLKPYAGRMATIWVPLQPCDGSRPGLDILPVRLDRLAGASIGDYLGDSPVFQPYVDRGPGIAHDSAVALGEEAVARAAGGRPLWRPQLQVGDVLVFDGYTIHRSGMAPGMQQPRTSIELRCVPTDAPAPQDSN